MIRRFAVCVLVGTLGLGVAPRPAFAARDRVVTGNHYRCMYHCDQRAHLFEDAPQQPTSGHGSLAQTMTTPKSGFCRHAAPDPNNPPANPPTLADRLLSWLYSAFCTSPTALPAPAPLPQAGPPPAQIPPPKPPPPAGPPPAGPRSTAWPPPFPPAPARPWPWPPTGGQPGGWPHFTMPWPQSHGPFWWDPWDRWDHEDPWDDDDRWDYRVRRDHDADDREHHKRDRDDDDREHRKDGHRDDDDWREHRKGRHHDDDGPAHRHHPRDYWDF
jgi:hypothetical protein